MLDLRITHDRWGSRSNPIFNCHLHYPTDIDRTLNEATTDKISPYRVDYNNCPSHSISFMPDFASTSGHLHCDIVCPLFCSLIGKLTSFLQLQEFRQCNPTSTSAVPSSPDRSNPIWDTMISSSRLQSFVLTRT